MVSHVQDAVILAAGLCSRIKAVWPDKPKGLIELEGEPIIKRSISQLFSVGIERVILVTGYGASWYQRMAQGHPGICLVHNARYADAGSMISLYAAKDLLRGPFLLLDSDLIYETRALTELLAYPRPNAVLLSGITHGGDEYYVQTSGDRYDRMSRSKDDLDAVKGEHVGICRVDPPLFAAMVRYAQAHVEDIWLGYDWCLDIVSSEVPLYCCQIEDLVWAEIDDPAQLKRAQELVYPRLMAQEAALSERG